MTCRAGRLEPGHCRLRYPGQLFLQRGLVLTCYIFVSIEFIAGRTNITWLPTSIRKPAINALLTGGQSSLHLQTLEQ